MQESLNYPMRSLSKCGKYLVDFTLADGPCPLDVDHFVLTERPGSPILTYDTVMRGFDIINLFEGDIVEDEEGNEYLVSYYRGINYKNIETGKSLKKINGKTKIISNIYKRDVKEKLKITPQGQSFKYNDIVFNLRVIYGVHEGKLLVNADGLIVDPQEVQQYTGIRVEAKQRLFFGDNGLTLSEGIIINK